MLIKAVTFLFVDSRTCVTKQQSILLIYNQTFSDNYRLPLVVTKVIGFMSRCIFLRESLSIRIEELGFLSILVPLISFVEISVQSYLASTLIRQYQNTRSVRSADVHIQRFLSRLLGRWQKNKNKKSTDISSMRT